MTTIRNQPNITNLLKCDSKEEPDCYKLKGYNFNHIRELLDYDEGGQISSFFENGLRVKTLAHYDYDYRRFWDISFVYYKDVPFMMIQNAGREGDDHAIRFIFDIEKYKECITDLSTIDDFNYYSGFDGSIGLYMKDSSDDEDDSLSTVIVTDLDECKSHYIRFYGNDIYNDNDFEHIGVAFKDLDGVQ